MIGLLHAVCFSVVKIWNMLDGSLERSISNRLTRFVNMPVKARYQRPTKTSTKSLFIDSFKNNFSVGHRTLACPPG